MSNIDTLLNSYGQDSLPEAKKRNLELATAEKLKALNGISSTTFTDAAVATQGTDQGSGSANEIERDIRYLSDYELRDKYGDTADYLLEQRALADIGIKNTKDLANSKTGAVGVGQDVLTSTAHGVAGLIGGLTYLGTLGVDATLGTTGSNNVAQANKAVSDWINKGHTIYNEADTKISSQQSKLNQRDTKALYDERMKAPNANPTEAWLRRVGQDFVDEVVNTGGSAEQLTNLTGEAIGSIGGIGALTKLAVKGGTKALAKGVEKELLNADGVVVNQLQKHGRDIATTALIGATEGGSIGAEAVNKILATDTKVLLNDPVHGERFKALVDEHGEARAKELLAKEIGLVAAGKGAVVGAALGKLVSKFEGNPLQKLTTKDAYAQLAGQAVEETLQEGSGQFIQNSAIQDKAISTQDLAEGVGSGAAKGFLGGVMGNATITPKALAAPVTDPTIAVTKYLGKEVVKQAANLGKSLYTGVLSKIEGKSPVSDASVANAASAVLPTIPAAKAVVETVINTPDATPENIKAAEYANKLMDALVFEAPPKGVLSPLFDTEFEGVTSTIEAAQKLSKIVNDKSVSEDDRFTAIQNLHGLMTGVSDALLEGAEEALPEMENLPELKQYADNFTALVNSFKDSPAMKSVMPHFETILETGIALGHYKEIDVNNLNDPAEQENLDNILKVATTTNGAIPEKLGDSLDKIMDMIDTNQDTGITKAQKSAIIGLATEMRIGQKISEAASNMGLTNLDIVNKQIILDEAASQTHTFPSAREHSRGITAALAKDNLALATQRLQTLQNFAVHLNNKVEALNKHIATAKMGTNSLVPFMGYRVKMGEEWSLTPKGVYVNLNSDKSKQLAKTISLEALALTNIHNQLAKAYPELGFKSIKSVEINPVVNGGVAVNANRETVVNTVPTVSVGATGNNNTGGNTGEDANSPNLSNWAKVLTKYKGIAELNKNKKYISPEEGEHVLNVLKGLPKDFAVDPEYQKDFEEIKEYFVGKEEETPPSNKSSWKDFLTIPNGISELNAAKENLTKEEAAEVVETLSKLPKDFTVDEKYKKDLEEIKKFFLKKEEEKPPEDSTGTGNFVEKWVKLLTHFKGLTRLNEIKKTIPSDMGERIVKVLQGLPKDFQVDEEYEDDFKEVKEYFLGKTGEDASSGNNNNNNSGNTPTPSSSKPPEGSKTPEYLEKWGKLLTYFKGLARLNEVKKDISTELGESVVKVLESLPKDFQVDEKYQDDFNEIKEYFLGTSEEETTSNVDLVEMYGSIKTGVSSVGAQEFKANPEQQEGINKIRDFLDDKTEGRVFVLEGKAGTGKTSLIQEALAPYLKAGGLVHISAVSHKAKGVLEGKLRGFIEKNNLRGDVLAKSLAGMLGMKRNEVTGDFEEDPYSKNPSVSSARVLIVDEASMVNTQNKKILEKMLPKRAKLIYLGDRNQIAPIEPSDSPNAGQISQVFSMDTGVNKHSLVTRVRQGEDSSILPYADYYWNNAESENPTRDPVPEKSRKSTSELVMLNSEGWLDKVIPLFKKGFDTKNPNLVKILAFNNLLNDTAGAKMLRKAEQTIRESLFGKDLKEYNKGELVILNSGFRLSEEILLENSTEYVVERVEPYKKDVPTADNSYVELEGYTLTVTDTTTKVTYGLPVLARHEIEKHKAVYNAWAKRAKATRNSHDWEKFWEVKEGYFAPITYSYVITTHKAQGSTYDVSVILEDNIQGSPDKVANVSRIMYTAITRASKLAVIVSGKNSKKVSIPVVKNNNSNNENNEENNDTKNINWFDRFWEYVKSGYYQNFIKDLEKTKSAAEIKEINKEIRNVYLDKLRKDFPKLGKVTLESDDSTISVENIDVLKKVEPTLTRLMVGNHGIYIEFDTPENTGEFVKQRLQYKEYRRNGFKLYAQEKTVNYADYKVGKWYIDVNDALNKNTPNTVYTLVDHKIFSYGDQKREGVTSENHFDAMKKGERTAATSYESNGDVEHWKKLKVGDILEWTSSKGEVIKLTVTRALHKLTDDLVNNDQNALAESWSKKEGWSVEYFNKKVAPNLNEAWQLEYVYEDDTHKSRFENISEKGLRKVSLKPIIKTVSTPTPTKTSSNAESIDINSDHVLSPDYVTTVETLQGTFDSPMQAIVVSVYRLIKRTAKNHALMLQALETTDPNELREILGSYQTSQKGLGEKLERIAKEVYSSYIHGNEAAITELAKTTNFELNFSDQNKFWQNVLSSVIKEIADEIKVIDAVPASENISDKPNFSELLSNLALGARSKVFKAFNLGSENTNNLLNQTSVLGFINDSLNKAKEEESTFKTQAKKRWRALLAEEVPNIVKTLNEYVNTFLKNKVPVTERTKLNSIALIVANSLKEEEPNSTIKTILDNVGITKDQLEIYTDYAKYEGIIRANKEAIQDLQEAREVWKKSQGKAKAKSKWEYTELLQSRIDELAKAETWVTENSLEEPLTKFRTDLIKVQGEIPLHTLMELRELHRTPNGKLMNFLVQEDGSYYLDHRVAESIAIAGIGWIAGNATSGTALDRKELSEVLGVDAWSVPKDALIAAEKSVFSGIVIQGIADSIRKTLNLTEKQNAYLGDTQGLLLSLSANVVEALKDNGLLDLQTVNITDKETKKVQKSFNYYRATPLVGTIYSAVSEVIEDTVVEESLKTPRYIVGSPQKLPVSNKIKHSSVNLTHSQKNMVQTANRVPTFVNLPVYNFFKAIGVDGLVKLFAHGELEEDSLHPEDYISKLGKNRSISAAWEKAEVMLKDVTNVANTQGKEVDQVPVYFSKSVNSAGRLDFDESYSIQSSKVNRPVFVATRKEVDLTNSTNKVNFLRGIAQGMGVKIHNLSAENSLAKLQEIVETPEVVNALKLIGEHKEVFTEEDIDVLKAAMPFVDNTEWGLTNLVEYQRYLETPEKDLNKFTTPVAIEADGATNGTANSLHLLANKITPRLIQLWKMTGFFIGSSPRSLNEEREVNPTDIYLTVAKGVSEYLPKYKQEFYKNQPIELQPAYEGGEALIRLLNITVTVDSAGNIELSRASAKNPVTVSVYRSSVSGIAEKITGELAKELYSQISLKLQGTGKLMIPTYYEELVSAFKLIDATIKLPAFDASNAAWQAFALDGVNFALTAEAVKYAYAQPLYKVISNEVLGTVNLAANVMVKIANTQGALIKEAYERAIREKIESKLKDEPSYRRSDYLTNKELKEISADIIKRFGGVIRDDYQNATVFMKSVKSSVAGMPHTAASLQDTAKAYPSIETFEEPGVSIVPNSVIRSGDGLMVQHFINDPVNNIDNLPIFDGIMVNIADIEKASLLANKAVYRTWTEGTPMEAVVASFEKALSAVDFDKISSETANFIISVSGLSKDELQNKTIKQILEDILTSSKEIVIDIKAQQEVVKRVPSSTDQMASVGKPHHFKGSTLLSENLVEVLSDNPSEEELAEALEAERAAIAAELRKAAGSKGENISSSSTPPKSELVVLDSTNVVEELKRLAAKNTQYSKLMGVAESVVGAFRQAKYTILRGDTKDVHAHLVKMGDIKSAEHALENNKGFINPTKRLIVTKGEEFIVLLHEMIHASVTYSLTIGLHTKEPKTSAEKRAVSSVKQIKVMFSEFVSDEFAEHFKNDPKALDAYLAIKEKLTVKFKDDEYTQLNEFLAYVLGNSRMLNILSNVPTKATIASKFLDGIRKAIARFFEWSNNSPETKDFFSTLVFHATTLAHDNLVFNDLKSTLPISDYELGSRLDTLHTKLKNKFKERMAASTVVDKTILTNNLLKEKKLADDIIAAGFYLDQEELNLYSAMNLAMQIGLDTNAVARTQLQDVFAKILQNITVEHFYPNDNPTQNEKDIAANKLHAVFGRYQGGGSIRQDTLANFVALATVSPELQKIINEIAIEEFNLADDTKDAFDTWVGNLGNKVIDSISDYSSKVDKTHKTRDAYFNSLVDVLFNAEQDNKLQNNALLKEVSVNTDKMNSWLADNIQKGGQKINELSEPLRNSDNRFAKFTGDVVRSLNAIVNKDIAEVAVQDINKEFNRKEGFQEFRDLLRDLFGRTEDNARVYDLVKPIRTYVDKVRQAYKGTVPVIIKQKFTKPVTKEEYSILSTAIGKTALNTLGSSNLIRLATGKLKASDRIAQLENKLSSLNSNYFVGVQAKAKQLAKYNIEGVVGDMLLRNPYAIAHRFDGYTGSSPTINSAYVDTVAELISLYSYELLPESHKEVLSKLGQQDPDALVFISRFLDSIRSQEKESLEVNLTAKVNSYFGHLPQLIESEGHLRIAEDTEFTSLMTQGYTRVGDYVGDSRDPLRTKSRGYYYNPLDTGVEYKQGIIQNIHGSAAGVDLETGLTVSKLSAGLITDPTEIKRILNGKYKESDESLLPVYNGQKQLIAFERTVSNRQLARLKLTTDLPTLLGAMRGRQAEESLAKIFLTMSLDALADTYKNDPDKSQYVDLFDEEEVGKDKVLEFGVGLFSRFAKDEIKRRFGGSFYVKREMLTDVVGFRKASVTDIFTGVSRYSPETVKTLRAIALSVFGENAYKYLSYSEKYIQEGVSFIKGNIIVRSVVVPVANILSNALHLLSLGIPLQYTLKAIPKKIAELEHYSKAKTRLMAIEIEMDAANKNDSVLFKRLIAEKKSLESTLQRMTIAPLILAGELSNINDVGLGEEDKLLFSSRLGEYFSKLLDKTPKGVKVAGKHLMLAEDTALYAGLQKSVLYGDFIAKAIQYDFLTQVKKVNSKDAIVTVSSEFISYDHLPGRGRDYLESMGLLWFYNYKLRSLRVALNAIRNNPLYSILFGGILGSQLNIDSPLDSNIVSQTFDGTVGNSLGIGMGIDGVFSNPYVNLIS